jgi:ABC-2 type transport system ATP-binding protein
VKRNNGKLAFTYKTSQIRAEEVLSQVHNAGITIKDVRTEDPHLEDVFLNLTRA